MLGGIHAGLACHHALMGGIESLQSVANICLDQLFGAGLLQLQTLLIDGGFGELRASGAVARAPFDIKTGLHRLKATRENGVGSGAVVADDGGRQAAEVRRGKGH